MKRRRWGKWALVVLSLAIVSAVIVWRMSLAKPTWYAPPNADDASVTELADRVEYRLVQEAQQVRPTQDTWTLRIREEQINAWLATRLHKWVAHHENAKWPEGLGTPQVHITVDDVRLTIPLIDDDDSVRYLTGVFHSHNLGDESSLRLARVQLGHVGLPGKPLANLLRILGNVAPEAANIPELAEAFDRISGETTGNSTLRLSDGRVVLIQSIALHDGALDIAARTLKE